MSNYGVLPTGFNRKPLSVILAEIEAQLITEFGPDVIQTPQSPLGQVNGLMADMIAQLWEQAEDVYQAYDPDQAEGNNLDTLAKIRLLRRGQESDALYRRSITNEGIARIGMADFQRALRGVPGVEFARVFVNETNTVDENELPPNTIAAAVIGGEDLEVGEVVNRYVTPGISTHGNVSIQTDEEGFCREFQIVRPVPVPITLSIDVRMNASDCPAPSPLAIGSSLLAYLRDPLTRPVNGQDITPFVLRQFIESSFPQVEFVQFSGTREGQFTEMGIPIHFLEIALIEEVTINVVR